MCDLLSEGMQFDFMTAPYLFVVLAFMIQIFWFMLQRRGQIDYAQDLYHFRGPTTVFSRYYAWRSSTVGKSVIDAGLFNIVSLGLIVVFGVLTVGPEGMMEISALVVLIGVFSVFNVGQIARRVRERIELERTIIRNMSQSVDKVGEARRLVEQQVLTGQSRNPTVWFALFRVAQIQDQIGWSLRDVLLEERNKMTTTRKETFQSAQDEDAGPSIGG